MAGIYIHIPFCRKACVYCDFHFSTKLDRKQRMLASLSIELSKRRNYLHSKQVSSIYFGGGTPSILEASEIRMLLEFVAQNFDVDPDAEISLEANPDDLHIQKLNELRQGGINRLSIGIQSFDQADLIWMNRSHTATQALECVKNARQAGFSDISIDLIYALPGKELTQWEDTVGQALELKVPHLSAYALTVEEKTLLNHWVKSGQCTPADDEQAYRQFVYLSEALKQAGYEHYEVSNFALPGSRAKHNSSYWKGEPYLGIGPSAHSFDGESRQWNISNNQLYINSVEEETDSFQHEKLRPKDRYNEWIMTGLRTSEGVNIKELEAFLGKDFMDFLLKEAGPLIKEGKLERKNDQLLIPEAHRFFSDGIASSLFYL